MENITMQLQTIADRLYGVRLPVMETGAINTLLICAHELETMARQLDEKAKTEAAKTAEK